MNLFSMALICLTLMGSEAVACTVEADPAHNWPEVDSKAAETERLALSGDVAAMKWLGEHYLYRKHDLTLAYRWFAGAADSGDSESAEIVLEGLHRNRPEAVAGVAAFLEAKWRDDSARSATIEKQE